MTQHLVEKWQRETRQWYKNLPEHVPSVNTVRVTYQELDTLISQIIADTERAERERIRDIVNDETNRSFYVGIEMWRNDAYKKFRTRILDVVFARPKDIRPCQFQCGNNIDWIISNDDGDEFLTAFSIQCGHCGQLNTTPPPQETVTK